MAVTLTTSAAFPPLHVLLGQGLPVDLNDPNTRWGLIGLAVAGIIYATVIRPKRRRKDPLERSPMPTTLAQQRSVERDMSNLLVELSEMARQMTAQIDNRATKLELLIREADEKIATLRAAASNGRGRDENGEAAPFTRPGAGADTAPSTRQGEAADPPAPTAAPAADLIGDRHAAVYGLADAGRSPLQIAQQLGRPTGEIELILALRNRG